MSDLATDRGRATLAARSGPARTRWPLALLLFGAGLVVALQLGKAVAALPTLRVDMGLSLVVGGWVISAFNVAGAVSGLLIGATIDRIGHRRAALAGLTLATVCSGLGALTGDAPALLATRFGEGLGFTLTVLAVPPLLVRVSSARQHGLVFGIWAAYMPAGIAVATAATPYVLSEFGWRGLWLAAAALNAFWVVAFAAATRTVPRSAVDSGTRIRSTVRAVATSRGPLLLAGVFAAYSLQFLSVFGFLPTLLTGRYGVPAVTAAALTALALCANIPGNILGGALRKRGVPRWILICCASAVMAGSALGIYAAGLPIGLRYGSCLVLSFAGGVIPATLFGAVPRLAPSPRAVAATVGVVQQGAVLGQALGPPAVAAVAAAAGGWQASPMVLAAAAVVAAGLGLALRRFDTATE